MQKTKRVVEKGKQRVNGWSRSFSDQIFAFLLAMVVFFLGEFMPTSDLQTLFSLAAVFFSFFAMSRLDLLRFRGNHSSYSYRETGFSLFYYSFSVFVSFLFAFLYVVFKSVLTIFPCICFSVPVFVLAVWFVRSFFFRDGVIRWLKGEALFLVRKMREIIAMFLRSANIEKLAFRNDADYGKGESQIADACLRHFDSCDYSLALGSSLERAKTMLEALGIDGSGCIFLVRRLDYVIAGQVKRCESDLGLKDNISWLVLIVTALGFISGLCPNGHETSAFLFAAFLCVLILNHLVYRSRRESWDEAFNRGNMFKLKLIRDDLSIYVMTEVSHIDIVR